MLSFAEDDRTLFKLKKKQEINLASLLILYGRIYKFHCITVCEINVTIDQEIDCMENYLSTSSI